MSTQIQEEFSYRNFLKQRCAELTAKKMSLRALNKRCGFKSSNYLQLIIQGKRNLSPSAAQKLCSVLKLTAAEKRHFLALVEYNHLDDPNLVEDSLAKVAQTYASLRRISTSDVSMADSWLHGLVYELAAIPDFELTIENIARILKTNNVSHSHIQQSIEFLLSKSYLIPTEVPNRYQRKFQSFEYAQEGKRYLSVQQNHVRYLEMAKLRMVDSLETRDFRGLTIAVNSEDFPEVQRRMRAFIDDLDEFLSTRESPSCVMRIQMAAFRLSNDI